MSAGEASHELSLIGLPSRDGEILGLRQEFPVPSSPVEREPSRTDAGSPLTGVCLVSSKDDVCRPVRRLPFWQNFPYREFRIIGTGGDHTDLLVTRLGQQRTDMSQPDLGVGLWLIESTISPRHADRFTTGTDRLIDESQRRPGGDRSVPPGPLTTNLGVRGMGSERSSVLSVGKPGFLLDSVSRGLGRFPKALKTYRLSESAAVAKDTPDCGRRPA
jgi:hypothetical protein